MKECACTEQSSLGEYCCGYECFRGNIPYALKKKRGIRSRRYRPLHVKKADHLSETKECMDGSIGEIVNE